jgi:hypothetical protein
MAELRGFTNLALVNRALRELYLRLSPAGVRVFYHDFHLTHYENNPSDDPVIRVQKIARHLANHYRIKVSSIIVTFRSDISAPGRIELSPASDFFVEINSEYRYLPKSIVAILAHEIAHIFLFQAGIRMEPLLQNEILTDTTAVFLGCGAAILNGATTTSVTSGNIVKTQTRLFGYISVDEFGYVQAKRDAFFHFGKNTFVDQGLPMAGYRAGRLRLQAEHNIPPFVRPGILTRTYKGLAARLFTPPRTSNGDNLTIACQLCSQGLRIPLLGKRISVRCPTCKESFICHT